MILQSFSLALAQLGDPRFRRVLLTGVALTLGLLIAASVGFMALVGWLVGEDASLPFIGQVAWLNDVLSWTSLLVMIVLSVFLMVPVASAITSMFLDEVAQAVEDKHYPGLPEVPGVPVIDAVRDTVGFLGVLILANLLALILYVIFTPLAPFIFWALNGFLLGREYFTLAAIRRVGRVEARKLRARNTGTIWLAGTLMAIPLSVPLVNLVIPILGAATFTHIFHRVQNVHE
ncbi:EI24 domain-containing protein [Sedimentitalea arenosa]|uniref:EI24 domain-containing protein n=1 Tax=Sedimentitalea arenosa TaxID=2798803 RepID=A0A8J7IIC4_9RHOB|nr:EI24 domain-containing protein [Arenibacterium arenosum]MBJ6371327.1 EI24 domain-containing protein [Arenibacterium arenosum]